MSLEPKQLGKAFALGYAFYKGVNIRSSVANDGIIGKILKWITVKGAHIPIGKGGKPLNETGKKALSKQSSSRSLKTVGPDKLPSFKDFASTSERKNNSTSKNVKKYAIVHLKPIIESLRYPKGMPNDCNKILMSKKMAGELANHINDDKLKALPYIADVYRNGKYRIAPEEKNPFAYSNVIYTSKTIKVDGENFNVELVSKKLVNKREDANYVQYGISKVDKVSEDSKTGSAYALIGVRIL